MRSNAYLLAVLLTVEEPVGDVELAGVGNDGLDGLDLVLGQFAGALAEVNIGLLADQVGETTANTADLGQGNGDVLAAVHIRVQNTQDVLKLSIFHDESHSGCKETERGRLQQLRGPTSLMLIKKRGQHILQASNRG